MKRVYLGIHFGIILLHALAGFFVLSFFLSLFVYIYLQQLPPQQLGANYTWVRMIILPLIGLSLGAICSYVLVSKKNLALKHTLLATLGAFLIYYGDYYFGSFLHRKYTNILYSILESPSMNVVLIGYILLTLLLGGFCYYLSYKIKIQKDKSNSKFNHRADILDEGF